MKTAETGYYETEVVQLIISDDKELRQRFIIGAETILQDSDTDVATHHRKIEDVTRYPELTASNNNKSNDIKDRVKKQSWPVETVIPLCDVIFENIDLAACLRPLVSCLSLKIALSVVDSSLLFIKDICRKIGSLRLFVQS